MLQTNQDDPDNNSMIKSAIDAVDEMRRNDLFLNVSVHHNCKVIVESAKRHGKVKTCMQAHSIILRGETSIYLCKSYRPFSPPVPTD